MIGQCHLPMVLHRSGVETTIFNKLDSYTPVNLLEQYYADLEQQEYAEQQNRKACEHSETVSTMSDDDWAQWLCEVCDV